MTVVMSLCVCLCLGYFQENILLHFIASMISGLITTAASMPVDIAKTRFGFFVLPAMLFMLLHVELHTPSLVLCYFLGEHTSSSVPILFLCMFQNRTFGTNGTRVFMGRMSFVLPTINVKTLDKNMKH